MMITLGDSKTANVICIIETIDILGNQNMNYCAITYIW